MLSTFVTLYHFTGKKLDPMNGKVRIWLRWLEILATLLLFALLLFGLWMILPG